VSVAADTRVLIVDDSPTARHALTRAIEDRAAGIHVVGTAGTVKEALRLRDSLRPDIVTMDVHLGKDDGVELAARMMSARPLPIVVITAADPRDPALAFRVMDAGALEVLAKPHDAAHARYGDECRRLRQTVSALARVPVVTRRRHPRRVATARQSSSQLPVDVVLIGASTGGPPVVQQVLAAMNKPLAVPVAVVQHIADGFVAGLARWLESTTGHPTLVLTGETVMRPGVVYLANTGTHLEVTRAGLLTATPGPPRNYQLPSIDVLFESAATHLGARACAVLLTGMGRDGADGLAALRQHGALTIAQEPSTCVVDSMPASAIQAGAAASILPPERIGAALDEAIEVSRRQRA
jgi:two-component system, chemotaxis family, protein-glutamate methylesterase/glutaminase